MSFFRFCWVDRRSVGAATHLVRRWSVSRACRASMELDARDSWRHGKCCHAITVPPFTVRTAIVHPLPFFLCLLSSLHYCTVIQMIFAVPVRPKKNMSWLHKHLKTDEMSLLCLWYCALSESPLANWMKIVLAWFGTLGRSVRHADHILVLNCFEAPNNVPSVAIRYDWLIDWFIRSRRIRPSSPFSLDHCRHDTQCHHRCQQLHFRLSDSHSQKRQLNKRHLSPRSGIY